MSDFRIDQTVTWAYTPRGGYGYTYPVNGVVTKVGPKRVQIEVMTRRGEPKRVWVTPDKLAARNKECVLHEDGYEAPDPHFDQEPTHTLHGAQ